MRSHRVREAEHFLANPGPYCSTTHLDSPLKNVTNNDGLPTQGYPVPQAPIKTYGMSRRKKHMNESDLLALIVLVVCFVASIVTISPQMMFAWRLGLKRQVSHHYLELALRESGKTAWTIAKNYLVPNHRLSTEYNEPMLERHRTKDFPDVRGSLWSLLHTEL